jgi:hypothetical protein
MTPTNVRRFRLRGGGRCLANYGVPAGTEVTELRRRDYDDAVDVLVRTTHGTSGWVSADDLEEVCGGE